MGLEINKKANESGYIQTVPTTEIKEGQMTAMVINNLPVILTKIKGAYHAFSARCPHASGDLTQGELHRGRIDCPDHNYRFDIQTGYPVWPEDEVCRLKKFPVKEADGFLWLKI